MRGFIWLLKRQIKSYLLSPFFYLLMALFLLVAGFNFTQLLRESVAIPLRAGDILFASVYLWLMLIVVVALLTMPLIADEKKSRTLDTLLSVPITETQIILAKYAAALIAFFVIVVPIMTYPFIMRFYSETGNIPDLKQVAAGFLILFLVISAYIALGLMVSALTKNQGIAAALSFTIMGSIFFSDILQNLFKSEAVREVISYCSIIQHITDFANGVIDLRVLVLYPTLTGLLLFIAVKILRLRMWT